MKLLSRIEEIILLSTVLLFMFIPQLAAQDIFDAVKKGEIENVKTIINKEPRSVHLRDSRSFTPLHIAADMGAVEITRLLIENGVDVNAKDSVGRLPLWYAIRGKYREIIDLLLKKGSEVTIYEAANIGFKDKIEEYLDNGGDIEKKEPLNGINLLHSAAFGGQKEMVEFLIEKGSKVNEKDDQYGYTPLVWANIGYHKEVIEYLISQNADLNIRDNNGDTSLDIAKIMGGEEIIQILKAKGAISTPGPDPEVEKVTENIYRITFPYNLSSNITVFNGNDGVLLVDTGYPRLGNRLKSSIKDYCGGNVKYIINTHRHMDHMGGNGTFDQAVAVINSKNLDQMVSEKVIIPGESKSRTAFDKYYIFRFSEEDILLIPAPGSHTNDDMLIYFPGLKIVSTGDVIFKTFLREKDETNEDHKERRRVNVLRKGVKHIVILEKIIKTFPDDITFIGGHGSNFTIHDLKEYVKMAQSVLKEN